MSTVLEAYLLNSRLLEANMKRLTLSLTVVILLSFAAVVSAQAGPRLITFGRAGIMAQDSPDAPPVALGTEAYWDDLRQPVLSPDQRYAAQLIAAPGYWALTEEQIGGRQTVPENVVVFDLQTGEVQFEPGQPENFPDATWRYHSSPAWSPTANQLVYAVLDEESGTSLQVYDADAGTLTTLDASLPPGFSDAGMVGLSAAHWGEVGVYSLEWLFSRDRIGEYQRLTLVDPAGQDPIRSMEVGTLLSGSEATRDTVAAYLAGLSEHGTPTILMVTASGEWFMPHWENVARLWRGTPILRPAGGGDIQVQFALTSERDPDDRPDYQVFIRHGEAAFELLDLMLSPYDLNNLYTSGGLYPAPDGSSVIYRDQANGGYVQWFGPGDSAALELDGRSILDWGDWVFQVQGNCFWRPNLSVIHGPQTAQLIREEPVRVFSAPGEAASAIGEIQPGETVRVVAGPLCVDHNNWYKAGDDIGGWFAAEGIGGNRFAPVR